MCVDTAPLNDGFAYNGTCSCALGESVRGFGRTLAIQGNIAAIGSSQSPSGCLDSGSISVYEIIDGTWQLTADLAPDNNFPGNNFPRTLSISNDVIVADSYGSPDGNLGNSDLTIFTRASNGQWQQTQQLSPDWVDRASNSRFTHDGDTIVIRENNGLSTFTRSSDNVWRKVSSIAPDRWRSTLDSNNFTTGPDHRLLYFAMSGDTLAVIEIPDYSTYETFATNLIIYERTGNTWQEQRKFTVGAVSGSLSIEGDTIIYNTNNSDEPLYSFTKDALGDWTIAPAATIEPTNFIQGGATPGSVIATPHLSTVTLSPTESAFLFVRSSTSSVYENFNPDIHLVSRLNNEWVSTDVTTFTPDYLDGHNGIGNSSAYDGSNILLGSGTTLSNRYDNTVLMFSTNSSGTFTQTSNAIVQSVSNTTIPAGCDYSNAESFDGWGWNPQTMLSCAPVSTNLNTTAAQPSTGCDYSDADSFDGWGWNADLRQSCAPLSSSSTTTTPVNTQATCVDSDGDGWGWDGAKSCRVSAEGNSTSNTNAACVDSDGDGWGWNRDTLMSCRI